MFKILDQHQHSYTMLRELLKLTTGITKNLKVKLE